MIVATVRTLRAEGYHSWTVALLAASLVGGIALLWSFRNLVRGRARAIERDTTMSSYSEFPVPPLPEKKAADA
jgi:hypothetical protein